MMRSDVVAGAGRTMPDTFNCTPAALVAKKRHGAPAHLLVEFPAGPPRAGDSHEQMMCEEDDSHADREKQEDHQHRQEEHRHR